MAIQILKSKVTPGKYKWIRIASFAFFVLAISNGTNGQKSNHVVPVNSTKFCSEATPDMALKGAAVMSFPTLYYTLIQACFCMRRTRQNVSSLVMVVAQSLHLLFPPNYFNMRHTNKSPSITKQTDHYGLFKRNQCFVLHHTARSLFTVCSMMLQQKGNSCTEVKDQRSSIKSCCWVKPSQHTYAKAPMTENRLGGGRSKYIANSVKWATVTFFFS